MLAPYATYATYATFSFCPHSTFPLLRKYSPINSIIASISYPSSKGSCSSSLPNIVMPVQELLRHGALKNLSSPSYISLPQLDQLSLPNIMSSFMPSIKALSKAALTYSHLALLSSSNTVSGGSPDTCSNPQISCQNTTAVTNTCCFNAPGGQLLQVRQDAQNLYAQGTLLTLYRQTQFWDADPSTGPVDSWTIHGLWYV